MSESMTVYGEDEFDALVKDMVAVEAPRLFAVVQERGERVDGRIAAWGMAFADRVEVVATGGSRLSLRTPERACQLLTHGPDITARLVWVGGQDAA
ncbi:hypothetical protein BLA60_37790 [Actinophytocola xinjiangensis]|uniref:Uncharacterized protein n=1 Tax=Actinophytocola xinjiangensis TaxID=485602 RepID=A0A7Z0WEL4_9PSEU|nr:hypothetical protein [Actinophytocola xinjiangensis]OLF05134.1 hypothetical protein BLA60_37790 [Actinophytocola xinjiangensis]